MAVIESLGEAPRRSPEELSHIVSRLAARPDSWLPRVRLRADRRWYERLHFSADYDVWLIAWMPGQGTGFHDHGSSVGAFAVASGALEEARLGEGPTVVRGGETRAFGADYAHDVRNASAAPAISIHAYSPPLTEMTHYDLDGTTLIPAVAGEAGTDGVSGSEPPAETRGIAEVLASARARLHRLPAHEASLGVERDRAVLVDIRPAAQRAAEGTIPNALIVERNVLEWRFDPASDARLPVAGSYDLQIIVICSEGYTSSLAAAALQEIGLWRATDVVGGFHAWRAAGLPTVDAPRGAGAGKHGGVSGHGTRSSR